MAPLWYGYTEFAIEDKQHQHLTNDFFFTCCSGLEHVITRKFSHMTKTYSLEHSCIVPATVSLREVPYTIHSDAFETDISGEVTVLGKFKIYTGNCVLLTVNCKMEMDRKTTSNMIRWLGNRDLMKFCKILEKNG